VSGRRYRFVGRESLRPRHGHPKLMVDGRRTLRNGHRYGTDGERGRYDLAEREVRGLGERHITGSPPVTQRERQLSEFCRKSLIIKRSGLSKRHSESRDDHR
jgi:hypothetical protein